MIEYIRIQNYQSHIDTTIRFTSGITAVTGLSMSGKTAVKRAFDWVRKNRPSGFRFNYRYGEEPTRVEIGVDNHIVTLMKGEKAVDSDGNKAFYSIMDPKGEFRKFTAFGTAVPEEITELLGISDISVQDQLDAYLLVISSAGEIARTINRITGIDIGDKWIKMVNQSSTSTNKSISVLEGEIGFLSEDVKKYEGVDDLKEKIDQAIRDDQKYEIDAARYNRLVELINEYHAAQTWLDDHRGEVEPLEDLLRKYEEIKQRISDLNKMREDINDTMLMGETQKELSNALIFLEPKLSSFEGYLSMKASRDGIFQIIQQCKSKIMAMGQAAEELSQKKRELADFLVSIGRCYVCGGDTCDHEKIMESL